VALSGVTCGLYWQFREFNDPADPFFKTTAIDHSAIPPHLDLNPPGKAVVT